MASSDSPAPLPSPVASSSLAPSASDAPSTAPTSSPYPYAFAPDVIRAHQKDAYFQGLLTSQLSDLHRRLLGARSAHAWAAESRSLADLLYLCLTTLPGNRTLGEEYCDLVQVEAHRAPRRGRDDRDGDGPAGVATPLPSLRRRAAYIAGSILVPYGLARLLPRIRARIRARLQRNLGLSPAGQAEPDDGDADAAASPTSSSSTLKCQPSWRVARASTSTWSYRVQSYLLANLASLTSEAHVHAAGLALFYFTGSYYELAKRLTGLRYVFASRPDAAAADAAHPAADRAGYELLGLLLVVQMAVQGYLHVRSTLASFSSSSLSVPPSPTAAGRSRAGSVVQLPLDDASNTLLLAPSSAPGSASARLSLPQLTHTPPLPPPPMGSGGAGRSRARYDLADAEALRWIHGAQQRRCTLCLEDLRDPAATPCGHVFCWTCIADWVREKPECPLCRRGALVQHVLPLRAVR
ncbi:Pex12 amino terminal region-domain-containing protein [Durotheca rogersii]|uniref:Pex12 amino terminal region-domain-containing protein n=1 Tax=Durotheca rogersii TaxID=419775 RepID=UPI00221FB8F1|nr:Pex12 amino terminal region-domain-containing protein [Durotheca rogersii]KAI5866981.1 Pex12 amino terminal region-domain-containing protein [Durotheca rogersii]